MASTAGLGPGCRPGFTGKVTGRGHFSSHFKGNGPFSKSGSKKKIETRRETDRETDLDFMSNHYESSGIHQEQLVMVMLATLGFTWHHDTWTPEYLGYVSRVSPPRGCRKVCHLSKLCIFLCFAGCYTWGWGKWPPQTGQTRHENYFFWVWWTMEN